MTNREYRELLAAIPGPSTGTLWCERGRVRRVRRYCQNGIWYIFQLVELTHHAADGSVWKAKSIAVFDGDKDQTAPSIRSARIYDVRCVLPAWYGPATRWG